MRIVADTPYTRLSCSAFYKVSGARIYHPFLPRHYTLYTKLCILLPNRQTRVAKRHQDDPETLYVHPDQYNFSPSIKLHIPPSYQLQSTVTTAPAHPTAVRSEVISAVEVHQGLRHPANPPTTFSVKIPISAVVLVIYLSPIQSTSSKAQRPKAYHHRCRRRSYIVHVQSISFHFK